MTVIKAPYNFVPFNKEVVTPHWIDQISHDIPFKDGLSGKIEVKLTAVSPIFVRDGIGQKAAKDNYLDGVQQKAHTFSQAPDGRYFIPGTSLKGMIRSVLEIMSFGRMEGKVNDHRYAVRDFRNNDLYNPSQISRAVKCGWLQKINGVYHLERCGIPRRISHKELSLHFKTDISGFFQNRRNLGNKSARMKYEHYPQIPGQYQFETWDDEYGRPMCKISPDGSLTGRIVFTGQPAERQEERGVGKHLEFVFPDRGMPCLPISDDTVIDNFFFAYYDHEPSKQSPDWKYWKPKLDKGEKIPVFFREEGLNVKDMGLSMLYKIAYDNSVLDSIRHFQKNTQPDFSEAIFGHVIDGKEQLRGRVHISHAFSQKATPAKAVTEVLSGPKASYYPAYIRQKVDGFSKVSGNYQTFMNAKPEIAGWKRYPVHAHDVKKNPPPAQTDSKKITTTFIPLEKGAEFTFTLRYHNLREIELGALLSALTFHGADGVYHTLGMAKPLGYGKLKVEITKSDHDQAEALRAFECYMNASLPKDSQPWHQTGQVIELIGMAQEQFTEADKEKQALGYMTLDDHVDAKRAKEALAPYSQLIKAKAVVPTYCNAESVEKMRRLIEEEMGYSRTSGYIEDIVRSTKEAKKSEAKQSFQRWKQMLLDQLEAQKARIKEQERLQREKQWEEEAALRKAAEQEKALAEGFSLEGINFSKSTAFDQLIKAVGTYARKRHGVNDSQLKNQFAGQYLATDDHELLLQGLKAILNGLNKRDRSRWLEPFEKNHPMRKVAEWIGEEKAREFLKALQA
ncbi:MAG: hypothetical protein OHK0039_10310 [Bacteroidia bacterium]